MSALASMLIALAAALLKVLLQQRQAAQDAQAVGRLTGALESLEAANAALRWKVVADDQPDRGAALRVRDGAPSVPLPGGDPGAPGPPD